MYFIYFYTSHFLCCTVNMFLFFFLFFFFVFSFVFFFFFFSSRRRHTRCGRDWSSDVCSSDLHSPMIRASINFLRKPAADARIIGECRLLKVGRSLIMGEVFLYSEGADEPRSEERRVGKECRSRWWADHEKKRRERGGGGGSRG